MSTSKREKRESEFPISKSSGAFKIVEIYDTFVYKRPKTYGDMGYSRYFCEDCQCYHTDHDEDFSSDEAWSEVAVELEMLKRYKHLSVFPPLLWEDKEDGFAMAKVLCYEEIEGIKEIKTREYKRIMKNINIDLIKKLKRNRIRTNLFTMEQQLRLNHLVEIGMKMKMPYERLLNNLYMLVLIHMKRNVLADAHDRNVGFYRGNVVIFDLGQSYKRRPEDVTRFMEPDISWEKRRGLGNIIGW